MSVNKKQSVTDLQKVIAEAQKQMKEVALNEVGSDSYSDAIEQLKADFEPLNKRFKVLKVAYAEAVAPWSPFANRNAVIRHLREQAPDEARAKSLADIATEMGMEEYEIEPVLEKGTAGERKVFVKTSKGLWHSKHKS